MCQAAVEADVRTRSRIQYTVKPHGEAAHRREGGGAGLQRVDFPRLIRGEYAAQGVVHQNVDAL